MPVYKALVTNEGKARIANAFVFSEQVDVADIVVDDGGGTPFEPTPGMNSVINEVWRGKVLRKYVDPKMKNRVTFTTIIPAKTGGFFIRGLGLLDTAGNLLCIANTPLVEKTAIDQGAVFDMVIGLTVDIEHAEVVNLVVNSTVIVATTLDIEAHNQDPHAHENRFAAIEAMYDLVRINHRLGCYPLVMAGKLQYGLGMAGFGEGPLGGTEMEQVAARALYHDPDSLTVRTVKAVADLGTPMLHQLSPTSYTVTFQGNETDSVYLQLYTDATYVTTPKVIRVSPNMGLKVLEE